MKHASQSTCCWIASYVQMKTSCRISQTRFSLIPSLPCDAECLCLSSSGASTTAPRRTTITSSTDGNGRNKMQLFMGTGFGWSEIALCIIRAWALTVALNWLTTGVICIFSNIPKLIRLDECHKAEDLLTKAGSSLYTDQVTESTY